jgi:hypothetical protein
VSGSPRNSRHRVSFPWIAELLVPGKISSGVAVELRPFLRAAAIRSRAFRGDSIAEV